MTYKRFFWRVGRTVLLYGWFIGLSVLMAALLERGLLPQFRAMLSRASRNIFCILTTTESVFNSACSIGRIYVVESGIDERRRLCAVRADTPTGIQPEQEAL